MYIPQEFNIEDEEIIRSFIRANPLGTFITTFGGAQPYITHLPFLLIEDQSGFYLEAHIAKENLHSRILMNDKDSTIVFTGAQGYISSSVYGHENVPTWNYQAVHVHGKLEMLDDKELIQHLKASVKFFERGRENPLELASISKELLNAYLPDIIGFRLNPYKVEAAFKLSQNRNETDFTSIVNDVEQRPDGRALAQAMKTCPFSR